MATKEDFDFSAEVVMAGGKQAEANWKRLEEHVLAEWSGDLDGTMATMTRNDPFQIMHGTGMRIIGWENVREFYRRRMEAHTGQGFYAKRWVVSEKYIVGNGYMQAEPVGEFFGVIGTGKRVLVPMTLWWYFDFDDNGLVKGEASYIDGVELKRQIEHGTDAQLSDHLW